MSRDTDILISQAGIDDLAAVMTIMDEAFDPQFGEAWTSGQCASMLSLPGSWMLLAQIAHAPAAFALLRSFAGEAELLLIATRPSFQRRDIATALIQHIRADCTNAGVKILHLEVRADNPALGFYRRHGFEQVGVRPNYYRGTQGRQTDALTLSVQIK